MGVDPDPLTLRELLWMAEGRIEQTDRLLWNHTSSVMAMQVNTMPFRKQGTKPVAPADFNPYSPKRGSQGMPIDAGSIEMLKCLAPGGST